MMTAALPTGRRPVLAWVLVGIFAAIAAILFLAIYVFLPDFDHIYALITIGVLALVFAVLAYFAQAISTDPVAQRSLSWGFGGMGLALLLLSFVFGPNPPLSLGDRFAGVILVLILAAVGAGVAFFQRSGDREESARKAKREEWASAPAPSAFQYKAAQAVAPPNETPTSPPPSGPGGS